MSTLRIHSQSCSGQDSPAAHNGHAGAFAAALKLIPSAMKMRTPPPAADPQGAAPSSSSVNPPAPSDDEAASAAYWEALKNGTADGPPPPNFKLPPGVTDQEAEQTLMQADHGLMANMGDQKFSNGVSMKDALAQYAGDKDWNQLVHDPTKLAAALGELEQVNGEQEAGGTDVPDSVKFDGKIDGWTSGGDACEGANAGELQDRLTKGQSRTQMLQGTRVHDDGTEMGGAERIGHEIAHAFEEIFKYIFPPLGDLIKMAVDGADKIRDDQVGDKGAAARKSEEIKNDGKNFGEDFAMAALSAVGGPEMAAIGAAVRVGVRVGMRGAEEAGGAGARAAAAGGRAASGAGRSSSSGITQAMREEFVSTLLRNSGKKDLRSYLADKLKHYTLTQVKKALEDQVKSYLEPMLQAYQSENGGQSLGQREAIIRQTVDDFAAQLENPKTSSIDHTIVAPIMADALPVASRTQEVSA